MLHACLLIACAVQPQTPRDLAPVIRKIEQQRSAPYAQRYAAVRKLTAIKSEAARKAALRFYRDESQPNLRSKFLEHAAGLPGIADVMRSEIESGKHQQCCIVATQYLVRSSKRGLAWCVDIARSSDKVIAKRGVLIALARSKSDPVTRAFVRLFDEVKPAERYSVLVQCRRSRLAHLDELRRDSLDADYEPLRAEAIRQLAQAGDAQAVTLARKLSAEKKLSSAIATAIFDGLSARPEVDDLPRLAKVAAHAKAALRWTLRRTMPKLVKHGWVRRWATDQGLAAKNGDVRAFALLIFEYASEKKLGGSATADALMGLARDRDPAIRQRAILMLAKRKDPRIVPALEEVFRKGGTAEKIDALTTLDMVLGAKPSFQDRLLRQTLRGKPELRLVAIDLCVAHERREILDQVPALLKHKDWRMRAAGIDAARQLRAKSSIRLLITALQQQKGRLAEELRAALAALTRLYYNAPADWQRWWKREGKTFVLPPPEKKPKKKKRRRPAGQVSSRTSATFYGIPVVSERVVYCLDVSGSMSAAAGTGSTRLELAQGALVQALKTSPKSSLVNVIFFETGVDSYSEKVVPLKKSALFKKLVEFVRKQKPRGGTNIHGALLTAFENKKVDTIFLLSDGSPSAGDITDVDALAEDIKKRNRARRIVIHGIAIGMDSPLLKRLAADSGGRYTRH